MVSNRERWQGWKTEWHLKGAGDVGLRRVGAAYSMELVHRMQKEESKPSPAGRSVSVAEFLSVLWPPGHSCIGLRESWIYMWLRLWKRKSSRAVLSFSGEDPGGAPGAPASCTAVAYPRAYFIRQHWDRSPGFPPALQSSAGYTLSWMLSWAGSQRHGQAELVLARSSSYNPHYMSIFPSRYLPLWLQTWN